MPIPLGQTPVSPSFQPPAIAQPNYFQPPDLDSVFNTVIRAQVAKSQMATAQQAREQSALEQRLQLAGQGIDASGDVNGQISQGLGQFNAAVNGQQGQPGQPQQGAPLGQPLNPNVPSPLQGGQQTQGQQINPGDYQNPHLANAFAQHLQMSRNMALLGGAKEQAATDKTQSETDLNKMWINQLQVPGSQSGQPGAQGQPRSPWAANIREDVRSGRKAPSQAYTESSRVGPQGMGKFMVDNALAGLPIADLEAKYAANTERQKSQAEVQGGKGQLIGSQAGSLEDILNHAEPLASGLSPTQFKMVNDAWAGGKRHVNDPKADAFLTLMNGAKGLYSQVIAGGAGTDNSDKAANESIGRGLTPQSFAAMKGAVNFEATSRVSRLQGRGFNQPGPTESTPKQIKVGRFSGTVE